MNIIKKLLVGGTQAKLDKEVLNDDVVSALLPIPGDSDEGKVPTVQSDGTYSLEAGGGGSVLVIDYSDFVEQAEPPEGAVEYFSGSTIVRTALAPVSAAEFIQAIQNHSSILLHHIDDSGDNRFLYHDELVTNVTNEDNVTYELNGGQEFYIFGDSVYKFQFLGGK